MLKLSYYYCTVKRYSVISLDSADILVSSRGKSVHITITIGV